MDLIIENFPYAVIFVCCLLGSISDIRNFKVYNSLTFPCFFGGLFFFALTAGWNGLAFSLGGALLGLGILILPYALGGIGAGDVKFVMAIGTWLGPSLLIPSIILGSIATLFYSTYLIYSNGESVRGTWVKIRILWFRLINVALTRKIEENSESVKQINQQSDRRTRLVPFSALFSLGIMANLAINWLIVDGTIFG